jgi:hypothetical protein
MHRGGPRHVLQQGNLAKVVAISQDRQLLLRT